VRVLLVLLFLIDWQPAAAVSTLPPPARFVGGWAVPAQVCEMPAPGWTVVLSRDCRRVDL
jgi:hypothetical protein